MDEVDDLILKAIQNLGCDTENVGTLKDLSASQTVEGVVRCLWEIDPGMRTRIGTVKLPPNMTAKYRMATEIADSIKEIGCRSELGYQTLLYGSEIEIRRLFVFLIERLPKEPVSTAVTDISPLEHLKLQTAQVLRSELSSPWVPWFCHRLRYQWNGRYWCPPDNIEQIPFRAYSFQTADQVDNIPWRDIPASLLEALCSSETADLATGQTQLDLRRVLQERQTRRQAPLKASKPALPPKPKIVADASQEPTVDESAVANQAELERLTNLIHETSVTYSELMESVSHKQQETQELHVKTLSLEEQQKTKQAELNKRNRFSNALENPSESLRKLQSFMEQSEVRLARLEAQWSDVRVPKQQELIELRAKMSSRDPSERLAIETREMQDRARKISEELEAKQSYVVQLQREYDKMGEGLSRSAYTKRILEIVASVCKQREQIYQVLEDTRFLQKEINMLTGNLERTFTAAEEKLYQDATSDELLRRAYRMLVNIHELCAQMVASVELTGHTKREAEDIQDSIETESQKSTDSNLERLVNDYCEVKLENEKLMEKLTMFLRRES